MRGRAGFISCSGTRTAELNCGVEEATAHARSLGGRATRLQADLDAAGPNPERLRAEAAGLEQQVAQRCQELAVLAEQAPGSELHHSPRRRLGRRRCQAMRE
jgi:hypothetical protein